MTRPFHHFLPKVVLRGFCIAGSEAVWYCQSKPPKLAPYKKFQARLVPVRRNIATIFGKRGLNTYVDVRGNENSEIEQYYSKSLENKWQPALMAARTCTCCADTDYVSQKFSRTLAEALYFCARRSPDLTDISDAELYQQYEAFVYRAFERLGGGHGSIGDEDIKYLLSRRSKEAVLGEVRVVGTATPTSKTLAAIAGSHMIFLKAPSNREGFIISSCPVLRMNPNLGDEDGLPVGFQTYMPISSEICIGFVRQKPAKRFFNINKKQIREFNSQLARQSSSVAAESKENLNRYIKYLKPA